MIVTTKYHIGHTYWVPRSFLIKEKEELQFEGETWFRDIEKYEASVKQKKIIKINIDVHCTGKIFVKYYVVNNDGKEQMSQVHMEDSINDYTRDEALAIAQEYAENQQIYYGN
jgi:hypothetical protein